MATKAVKGGFKVKKKDGTLGKTVFKTQKAAQSRSRGPGKKAAKRKAPARKSPAKKKTTRRTSVAKKGNPNNKSPKIGAVLQSVKGAQAVAAPFIHTAAVQGFNPAQNVPAIKARMNSAYAGSLLVEGANHAVDRKIAHGAALTRGSVTAWAAELFAAKQAFDAASGSGGRDAVLAVNQEMSKTIRGYDPQAATQDLGNQAFRTYQTIKIGGGVARRLSNAGPFKKMAAPLKKALGEVGLAL